MTLTLNQALCATCGETRSAGRHGPGGHRFERYAVVIDDPTPPERVQPHARDAGAAGRVAGRTEAAVDEYDPRHICGRCGNYCRTGPNRLHSPYWGTCGAGVQPGQSLKAGLPVFECYAFDDMGYVGIGEHLRSVWAPGKRWVEWSDGSAAWTRIFCGRCGCADPGPDGPCPAAADGLHETRTFERRAA